MTPGNVVKLGLGVVMIVLGVYVAVRPLLTNNAVIHAARRDQRAQCAAREGPAWSLRSRFDRLAISLIA
jgi:hypothetical protein